MLKTSFIKTFFILREGDTMEFKDIVMKRYASKKFDNKKIPDDKVNELFDIIRHAPSSLNIQPWKIKVITDDNLKKKLKPVSYNQEQITSCSHLLVFCADTDLLARIERIKKQMLDNGATEESIKGYMDMMTGYVSGMNDDEKLAFAQRQVFLALGNSVNGAKSLGFDSCPMGGFDKKAYAEILELPENIVPTVLSPIGYAVDTPKPKTRLPKEEVFF